MIPKSITDTSEDFRYRVEAEIARELQIASDLKRRAVADALQALRNLGDSLTISSSEIFDLLKTSETDTEPRVMLVDAIAESDTGKVGAVVTFSIPETNLSLVVDNRIFKREASVCLCEDLDRSYRQVFDLSHGGSVRDLVCEAISESAEKYRNGVRSQKSED